MWQKKAKSNQTTPSPPSRKLTQETTFCPSLFSRMNVLTGCGGQVDERSAGVYRHLRLHHHGDRGALHVYRRRVGPYRQVNWTVTSTGQDQFNDLTQFIIIKSTTGLFVHSLQYNKQLNSFVINRKMYLLFCTLWPICRGGSTTLIDGLSDGLID